MTIQDELVEARGHRQLVGWRLWLPLLLGLILSFAILAVARQRWMFDPERAAMGEATDSLFGEVGGRRIHCQDARDSTLCLEAYRAAGNPPAVLWLGNSQLHGVNRHKPGQASAPMLVHQALAERGLYTVTFSEPNANLSEHQLLFRRLSAEYRLRAVILPVCLDDFREAGIRQTLLTGVVQPAAAAPAITNRNGQMIVEDWLNRALSDWAPLWRDRQNLVGLADYAAYVLRNRLLGISAQSPRSVPGPVYAQRMQTVREIVREARLQGLKVVLYVPPYRSDVRGPYVETQYAIFRHDLKQMAADEGATTLDLTQLVPGPEWGMVEDPLFGFVDYDFMHFTAEGHRRLAAAIAPAV